MKLHSYFISKWNNKDRRDIRLDWVASTFDNPEHEEVEESGNTRRWRWIEEKGRYLRVIVLPDGETVLNSFWGRGFKGK